MSNRTAILIHESPATTVYSTGGRGVSVGRGVLVEVGASVKVAVAVIVFVMVGVEVSRGVNNPDAPTISAPPANSETTINPIATGNESVMPRRLSGKLDALEEVEAAGGVLVPAAAVGGGAWPGAAVGRALGDPNFGRSGKSERHCRCGLAAAGAGPPKSAPHTMHLVANSPTRVPQVGQSRGGGVEEPEGFVIMRHYTKRVFKVSLCLQNAYKPVDLRTESFLKLRLDKSISDRILQND